MESSMNASPTAVSRSMQIELIDSRGQACAIHAELSYDVNDPYAVTSTFHTAGQSVIWTFARDLLFEGLRQPAGDGDVHVWPCQDPDGHAVTILELNSPAGEALAQLRTADVTSFVQDVTRLVPEGTESSHLDLDRAIEEIFASF